MGWWHRFHQTLFLLPVLTPALSVPRTEVSLSSLPFHVLPSPMYPLLLHTFSFFFFFKLLCLLLSAQTSLPVDQP